MRAGGSATEHARLRRQQALEHERLAGEARAEAARFEVAADTERRIIGQLGRLSAEGFHLLADRAWPGSHTANVDAVVVGPSGVFIVDPKCWADVALGPDGLTRAGEPVDFSTLRDLGETTRAALADIGLPPCSPGGVTCPRRWTACRSSVSDFCCRASYPAASG